jgi:hypothetical protein
MKENMERFPARFPPDLKRALSEMAESMPGTSMNDLVVAGVRHVVEGVDLSEMPTGVKDAHEDLVVGVIEGDIAPAVGIANHFAEHGLHRLAALLFTFTAQMQPTDKEKARELVRSADNIQKRSRPIAHAMLEAALRFNPASDVAKSRLGQLWYREGDYERARSLLEQVREDDNYARLSYGWATLELAGDDPDAVTGARDEIVVALRRWVLGGRFDSREAWLKQVRRLKARGPDFAKAADDLVAYANDNAPWQQIHSAELRPPSPQRTAPADPEEPDGEA